ncbi:MAG: hypothetical protein D6790_02630 [Caldilineae bacterium]|nr:MAG: hypothetical protein D6790_02630 [Caldilineae bacterium]
MPVVEIDQRWVEELKSVGDIAPDDLRSIVDDALRQHFFYLRQKKIEQERKYYEANHAALYRKYAGKYIAIHNGEVVDVDEDGRVLARRVRQRFGRLPIAIIQVRDSPEPPIFAVRRPRVVST